MLIMRAENKIDSFLILNHEDVKSLMADWYADLMLDQQFVVEQILAHGDLSDVVPNIKNCSILELAYRIRDCSMVDKIAECNNVSRVYVELGNKDLVLVG